MHCSSFTQACPLTNLYIHFLWALDFTLRFIYVKIFAESQFPEISTNTEEKQKEETYKFDQPMSSFWPKFSEDIQNATKICINLNQLANKQMLFMKQSEVKPKQLGKWVMLLFHDPEKIWLKSRIPTESDQLRPKFSEEESV